VLHGSEGFQVIANFHPTTAYATGLMDFAKEEIDWLVSRLTNPLGLSVLVARLPPAPLSSLGGSSVSVLVLASILIRISSAVYSYETAT